MMGCAAFTRAKNIWCFERLLYYLVEYQNVWTDDGKSWLREKANATQIRPTPPRLHTCSFQVMQKVDAFHNDGWWAGIIVGEVADDYDDNEEESEKHYIVHPYDKLRVHQDWKNGRWVIPSRSSTTLN